MKLPDLPPGWWKWPAGAAGALGALWLVFRGGSSGSSAPGGSEGASGVCEPFSGNGKAIQEAINAALAKAAPSLVQPGNWMWAPPTSPKKPGAVGTDGRPGAMTCRAAEWLIANKLATPEIAAFGASRACGCGKKRAPCGVGGPTASAEVKAKIVAAGVAKGYPAEDVTRALSRESGWRAQALACMGSDKHPVAGGLNGMLNSVLTSNGFEGTADQFAALTAEEQLPYVLKFISRMPASCLHKKGDFGLALFVPAYVCKPDDFVIYEKGTLGWEQNPGLRTAGNGPITAGKVRSTG